MIPDDMRVKAISGLRDAVQKISEAAIKHGHIREDGSVSGGLSIEMNMVYMVVAVATLAIDAHDRLDSVRAEFAGELDHLAKRVDELEKIVGLESKRVSHLMGGESSLRERVNKIDDILRSTTGSDVYSRSEK